MKVLEEAVAISDSRSAMVHQEQMELTVQEIVAKVAKVREVAASVMKDGIHYGTIPGTQKPTLFKAGAEILSLTFRLSPRYEGERQPIDLAGGHREYVIRCDLYHVHTNAFFGSGVGSCSSLESKYRYRPGPSMSTGKSVPSDYWNLRSSEPTKAQQLLGGKGFSVKKVEGRWEIVQIGEPIENPNIADCYNTVLKIAAKRAYVDAILKATAASEVYTQDLEDMRANDEAAGIVPESAPAEQPRQAEPTHAGNGQPLISDAQRKRFYAITKSTHIPQDVVKNLLAEQYGYESTTQISRDKYEELCEWAQNWKG